MSALSPKARSQATTELRLKLLAKSYSKVVKNIQPFGGLDEIEREIQQYVVDSELDDLRDLKYSDYWEKVGEVKDAESQKYKTFRIADSLPQKLSRHDA